MCVELKRSMILQRAYFLPFLIQNSFPTGSQAWQGRSRECLEGLLQTARSIMKLLARVAVWVVSDNIWQLPPISLSAIQAPPPNCKVQAVNAEFLPRWCLQAPNLIEEKSRHGWWIRISGKKTSLLWMPSQNIHSERKCHELQCVVFPMVDLVKNPAEMMTLCGRSLHQLSSIR